MHKIPDPNPLLDYLYWGFGEKEFNELNGYYSTINPEYAADYQRFYDEIMEGEEKDGGSLDCSQPGPAGTKKKISH